MLMMVDYQSFPLPRYTDCLCQLIVKGSQIDYVMYHKKTENNASLKRSFKLPKGTIDLVHLDHSFEVWN